MATYNWGLDLSFTAAVDLNSYQYYFVNAGSVAGEVIYASTTGASCLGVLQNDPKAGEEATVRVLGVTKVKAGNAIAYGAVVTTASDAQANTFVVATACTHAVGIGLETISNSSIGKILLTGPVNRLADA
jgi:Uncharacterized conserved protein (DUF2190)